MKRKNRARLLTGLICILTLTPPTTSWADLGVQGGAKAADSALDISSDGPMCTAIKASKVSLPWNFVATITTLNPKGQNWPPFQSQFEDGSGDAANEADGDAASAALKKLWSLSHEMNEAFIKNITTSLPQRLSLAQHLGVDLSSLEQLKNQTAHDCAATDPNGLSLQTNYRAFASALNTKSPSLSAAQIDAYIIKATIAVFEYYRLQAVFREGIKQYKRLKPDSPDFERVSQAATETMTRLLILRERFPFLQNPGWSTSSGIELVSAVHSFLLPAMMAALPWAKIGTDQHFYGLSSLDEVLGYTAIRHKPGSMSGDELIASLNPFHRTLTPEVRFYPIYYTALLTKKRRIPAGLRNKILQAILVSVRQSIESVKMKCDASPCSTFQVQPELVARVATSRGEMEKLKPWLCQCQIGHEQTTVSTAKNIAIALTGMGLTVLCVAQPETAPLCYAAWAATAVDVGAGAAGIWDARVNSISLEGVAESRAGNAVSPMEEYRTQLESKGDKFNYYFDWITGLFSLTPYRVMKHPAYRLAQIPHAILTDRAISETTFIEFIKSASALPPPEMVDVNLDAVKQADVTSNSN